MQSLYHTDHSYEVSHLCAPSCGPLDYHSVQSLYHIPEIQYKSFKSLVYNTIDRNASLYKANKQTYILYIYIYIYTYI